MSIVNSLIRHVYAVLHYGDYLKSIRFLQDRYHWSHKRYPFTWLDDKYFLEYYFYKKWVTGLTSNILQLLMRN